MESYLNNRVLIVFFCSFFVLFSCKNEQKIAEEPTKKNVEYDMYQPSEMAGFMNAMYAYNVQLKQQIIAGETSVNMPLDLMKLHSAEMSNGKGRTAVWNSFVNVFIESQQSVADTISNVELKDRFNAAINNCLACHKTECVGPIPKIKKLLIQ
ncbi:hypothetical protein [Winogradskyella sp.]|uniref:hypothetical protein n=1 Tax=Winogradskyella sp. TaxID=1883156 RepID=UPI0025FCADB6|nr:hypothetical protein [Winogradskyella sp.]